jgi:ABC-type antimicrobial peptide transport system ATPase subunit
MSDIILETHDLHRRFVQGGGLFAKTTTIHAVNGVSLQVGAAKPLPSWGNPVAANPPWRGCCCG